MSLFIDNPVAMPSIVYRERQLNKTLKIFLLRSPLIDLIIYPFREFYERLLISPKELNFTYFYLCFKSLLEIFIKILKIFFIRKERQKVRLH